jgi:hypothetical protein
MRIVRRASAFSPDALSDFASSVASLPPEERQKAKVLYIRNGIAEFRTFEKAMTAFPKMPGCLSFIPFVGGVAKLQHTVIGGQLDLQRQQIVNAIDLWRDDLKAAGFDVDRFDIAGGMQP